MEVEVSVSITEVSLHAPSTHGLDKVRVCICGSESLYSSCGSEGLHVPRTHGLVKMRVSIWEVRVYMFTPPMVLD